MQANTKNSKLNIMPGALFILLKKLLNARIIQTIAGIKKIKYIIYSFYLLIAILFNHIIINITVNCRHDNQPFVIRKIITANVMNLNIT
jgi:hypothetical protein